MLHALAHSRSHVRRVQDVVESEESAFFKYNERDVADDIARLLLFNNVIVTGHQASATSAAPAARARARACARDHPRAHSPRHVMHTPAHALPHPRRS